MQHGRRNTLRYSALRGLALAARVAKNAPLATTGAEQGVKFTLHNPREAWAAAAPEIWKKVLASDDLREGLAAFAERRKPGWRNT